MRSNHFWTAMHSRIKILFNKRPKKATSKKRQKDFAPIPIGYPMGKSSNYIIYES